jgi:hypothetical protein
MLIGKHYKGGVSVMKNRKRNTTKTVKKAKPSKQPAQPKRILFGSGVKLTFSGVSYTRDSKDLNVVDYHFDGNQSFEVGLDLPGISITDVQVALKAATAALKESQVDKTKGEEARLKDYTTLQALASAFFTLQCKDLNLVQKSVEQRDSVVVYRPSTDNGVVSPSSDTDKSE